MAEVTDTYVDGLLHGAQDVTLGTITWTCADAQWSRNINELDGNNSFGVYRGSAYKKGKRKGTLTLMYPTLAAGTVSTNGGAADIAEPVEFTKFTLKTKGNKTLYCILLSVGENQGSEAEPKIPCTFAEEKNRAVGGGSGS